MVEDIIVGCRYSLLSHLCNFFHAKSVLHNTNWFLYFYRQTNFYQRGKDVGEQNLLQLLIESTQ